MAIAKILLSGSTNGRGIKVAATASAGTTIHTAVAGTSSFDELFLWAVNSAPTPELLTIQYGGTSGPDDAIEQTIEPESGLALVVPGLLLQNGLLVRAFSTSANVVIIHGFGHRHS